MKTCRDCGQPIEWDAYWTTWDHTDRAFKLTAELCEPRLGFDDSRSAQP